ncbi:MAG TPA: tRNA (guanosine(37)-N1)-methyltransferase TrmD [Ignavibacteria bacterium]|nr:tRNA (guanosine(37)-N1)-methyltransferase TrmD [Ignavibacteria bacterium]
MRIDIVSANTKILECALSHGLTSRAIEKQFAEIHIHNLREYAEGSYKQIDDTPYGGGAGMILKPEPIFKCVNKLKSERDYDEIIYFSPQGEIYEQKTANYYSLQKNIICICGHYKGIDQRVIDVLVTKEISIGNYVISCGDLAAYVFIDSVLRLIPGVLGDSESAITDSFQVEEIFDAPQYTRPEEYEGHRVPDILLSGNHAKIREWREQKAREKYDKISKKG